MKHRFGIFATVALAVAATTITPASAETPRATPWKFGVTGKQNGGNTYNCDTHDTLGPGTMWDRFALDLKIGDTGPGDPVAAMADGLIATRTSNSGAYGYMTVVDHGGFVSRYAHLDSLGLYGTGDRVRAGQVIGYEGWTGLSGSGSTHLHVEWGDGNSYTNATATVMDPLTGIDGSTYKALKNFDDPTGSYTSSCPGVFGSSYGGSRPLSDVYTYDAASSGDWAVRLPNGDGSFSAATTGSLLSGWEVVTGHFSDDSKEDLFLYNPTSGDWRFQRAKPDPNPGQQGFELMGSGTATWLQSADVYPMTLSLNGLTDLLIHKPGNGDFRTWLPTGNMPCDADSGTSTGDCWTVGQTDAFSSASWPAVVGYFDGDMRADIVRYNPTGNGWATWHGTSTGISGPQHSGTFGSSGWNMLVGEFNDNGYQDLYRYNPSGSGWGIQTGGTSGNWSQYASDSWSHSGRVQMLGYFNNDKMTDVLQYDNSSGNWQTQRANGSGGWTSASGTFSYPREIRTGYFDGDTLSDLLLYNPSTGSASTRLSIGAGDFGSAVNEPNPWANGLEIYVGHFDDI